MMSFLDLLIFLGVCAAVFGILGGVMWAVYRMGRK
ncbi:hypothetical protein SEA_WOLLYPOG_92 [Arthrobacter phage Wollypog]|uniref:Uncharacterized protein n=1 Tax=Arthrobacter phage Wollypog TaxID=2790985 RepID=A0A7T3KD94_9CAUD|nr:hypothetical protein PP291_gp92 [Arthrobacter phage Wollypog]QPX62645.1 hypothetical protein SEA_WOLLYPOG_92 [Arthrobacter phage Wollypog]